MLISFLDCDKRKPIVSGHKKKVMGVINSEEFFRSDLAEAFFEKVNQIVIENSRPSSEVILTEDRLCETLGVSKRHSAQLRAEGKIAYFKDKGKIYYTLQDVLDYLANYRVEPKLTPLPRLLRKGIGR